MQIQADSRKVTDLIAVTDNVSINSCVCCRGVLEQSVALLPVHFPVRLSGSASTECKCDQPRQSVMDIIQGCDLTDTVIEME